MEIITISNQNGGSAKTTITVNLAMALVERERKCWSSISTRGLRLANGQCQNDGKGAGAEDFRALAKLIIKRG